MRKILIANRGEIAVRVIRACHDLGLQSVAVYSDADRQALHVRLADEACPIGSGPATDSYLRIDRIIDAARAVGADAVHPGYGFLAESAEFAAACRDAGLTFIGPAPEVIERLGSKTAARACARSHGVPLVEGTDEPFDESIGVAEVTRRAESLGYPIMLKAVAGGGGKGMRVAETSADLPSALALARSEARAAFGDSAVYLERRLERPRHIEVQILGDARGRVAAFVERECSLQRRHQKVLEESPSPAIGQSVREAMQRAAVTIAEATGYVNAGTVEFLVDQNGRFAFLEVNTRLQVEHPVTELVTGVDLVVWQIRIARGEAIDFEVATVAQPRGHAIECRVYAEDADAGFVPSPGHLTIFRPPEGPGIRHDSGVDAGGSVPVFYDAMIAKLIVWGGSRHEAIARLRRALGEYRIGGVRTSIPFFQWLVEQPEFLSASFDTTYLDNLLHARAGRPFREPNLSFQEVAMVAAALHRTTAHGRHGATPSGWKIRTREEGLRP